MVLSILDKELTGIVKRICLLFQWKGREISETGSRQEAIEALRKIINFTCDYCGWTGLKKCMVEANDGFLCPNCEYKILKKEIGA